jgi:hypothetical protein
MDYQEYLSNPLSLRYVDILANEIYAQPADFEQIFQLIFKLDEKYKWRAAWTCQKISEKHPEWFKESHFFELKSLVLSSSNGGLLRGSLSILNNIAFPNPLPVDLLNACYDWMISPKYPIAVQAISMKLIYKFCVLEPELKQEFISYLENMDSSCLSAGMIAVSRNTLKLLNK